VNPRVEFDRIVRFAVRDALGFRSHQNELLCARVYRRTSPVCRSNGIALLKIVHWEHVNGIEGIGRIS
jgi:hypothetical protein